MHRRPLAILSFPGCLLLSLSGCSVDSTRPVLVRSIYVEEAVGAPSPELAQCADVIHDTSVRVLKDHGFVAAMEPSDADATLRAVWSGKPSAAGTLDGRVSLRMALVARDGTLLRGVDIITDMQAGFLTKERIADFIRTKLGTFTH